MGGIGMRRQQGMRCKDVEGGDESDRDEGSRNSPVGEQNTHQRRERGSFGWKREGNHFLR
jgi:hypothetical protein